MLNKEGQRELAYVVKVDSILPIEGAERVEIAKVGGWRIMVGKGQFQVGDLAIYFEIDSKVPEIEPFLFLESKNFHVKTQKYFSGKVISQGLLMSFEDLSLDVNQYKAGDFLTEKLEVTYYVAEDNERNDGDLDWPSWVVKTDEERIQNMQWILEDKEEYVATEKIDGTSTTATLKREESGKYQFTVCSRNVMYGSDETNMYIDMAERYHVEEVLTQLANEYRLEWVTLQGEIYGKGVQKREYGLKDKDYVGFNLIFSDRGRLGTLESARIMKSYGIPWVPILDEHFVLPDTVEELLKIVTGKSEIDGGMREGMVFRSQDGIKSFKAVSNEYLLKY